MPRYDYGGAVIPWYESPIIGGVNYTWQERPVEAPPVDKSLWGVGGLYGGGGGLGGFLTNIVNPILDPMAADPLKTAAILAATATGNAYLVPYIVGADTAIAGGSPEDVLKSAATAYVTQAIGGEIKDALGGAGFSNVTETGLPTVAGEGVASDLAGTTLLGDAGATGAYETAIDAFPTSIDQVVSTPDVVTPDVSTLPTDDATRLAQLIREFENPTELTGPTIDVASNPTVELGNATVDESYGLPDVPKDLQNEAYLDPGLIDVAPENVTIATPEPTPYFDTSPTFPTLDVSPEYDPSAYLPTNLTNIPTNLGEITPYIPTDLSGLDFQPSVVGSNLGGFDNIPTVGGNDLGGFDNIPFNLGTNLGGVIPTDLGGLDVPFDTTVIKPTNLSGLDVPSNLTAGELTVTGDRPYVPFEENFPLPYEPFEENFPIQEEVKPDSTAKTNSIKLGNLLKSSLQQSALTQQKLNLSNALRGSQMPQTLLPSIYKQQNPFNFGQQVSPVQDVSALAKLLRTA